MKKRNLYLTQVDALRETPQFCTAYLPYAAGLLWSYARQVPAVADHYELREMFCLRDPVDEVVSRMEEPYLVGFSCYCWSTEYNKALARAIKQKFPRCLVLFGGHNVPRGGAMLEELPYVDMLLHGEGELGFRALLSQLIRAEPEFTAVPGLSWRQGDTTYTNPEAAAKSLADIPSPYLEGVFDPIIAAHPEIQWSIVWETNRGCPYHCAYCDWGQHNAKVREFPMERLIAEVEWISKNKVEFIWCADANFGMPERDEAIADALVASKEATGYPMVFLSQTTKILNERLFRIFEKLCQSGLEKLGPNLAVQSLSPQVLQHIGRKNIDEDAFAYWIRRYRQAGYRTHTDLILGLPGETLQSFCLGIETLYELGQHEGICCYPCNLLPNSSMASPAFCEEHGIRTRRHTMKFPMESKRTTEPVNEYIDTIDETAAMPHADWLTAHYFLLLAQSVHGYGPLRLVAMYLHNENIISYAQFYRRLLEFCHARPDTLIGETMALIEERVVQTSQSGEQALFQIPGFSFGPMQDDQYFFSRILLEAERFFGELEPFLRQFVMEPVLLAELLRYQKESIILPGAAEKQLAFNYDFPAYFNAIYDGTPMPLVEKRVQLRFWFAFDLSSMEKYYDAIVRLGRYSNNVFYWVE